MYLTKRQIADYVNRLGQPKASVMLNRFFQSYCGMLTSSDVADLYDEEYTARVSGHDVYLKVSDQYIVNMFNKYSYEYLQRKGVAGNRLLDYGCGDGHFAMASCVSLGFEVVGVDFNAQVIQRAKQFSVSDNLSCQFVVGDVEDIPLGERFDFVTLNDVVEHLSDRELTSLLNALRIRLAEWGELIIHTPNGLALCNDTEISSIQLLYKMYIKYTKGWKGFERTVDQLYYDQVHINIKGYRSLSRLLRRCGYESKVYYDNLGKFGITDSLSPNMLVIAKQKGR